MYVIITIVVIAANGFISIATLAHAKFVIANFGEVQVRPSVLPLAAVLQLAGAAGLLLGLLGWRAIGIAAAIGLVLFFVVAVIIHLRSRAFRSISSPAIFLLLAIGALLVEVLR
ncbi:MAG: integral rane protein [Glaciihabitans sp.]|nr:integral rane protein [Glaciihabitans sp.]